MGSQTQVQDLFDSLRFQVGFDLINEAISFRDLIGLGYLNDYGYPLADVKGIIRISGPKGVLYQNAGWEDDNFESPDISFDSEVPFYNSGIQLSSTDFVKGGYVFAYKVSVDGGETSIGTKVNGFNYQIDLPSASLNFQVDKDRSMVTLTDAATYTISNLDENIEYDSITRLLTIRPPQNTPLETVIGTTQSITMGPNIWTGNYDYMSQTELHYSLASWGDQVWVLLVIEVTATGSETVDSGTSCIENCLSCIRAINEKLLVYRNSSPRRAEMYEKLRSDISFYYGLYMMYVEAGIDTTYPCGKIQELLTIDGDCTSVVTSNGSTEIIATTGSSGGTIAIPDASKWYYGTVVPSSAFGNNADFFLKTDNNEIYTKENGAWIHIMTIQVNEKTTTVTVTSDYTCGATDSFVLVDSRYRAVDINLPANGTVEDGFKLSIKAKKVSNTIRIVAADDQSIESATYYKFKSESDTIDLSLNGVNWEIR